MRSNPISLEVSEDLICAICGKPATRLVDDEPSCEEHAELVYEDQVENYTLRHQADGDWLEQKV